MNPRNGRMAATASAFAVIALALALLPASAAAETTIEMKGKTHKGLRFSGPDTVKAGSKLKIANLTDPERVGPHSFTLAKEKYLPTNGKEFRSCYDRGHICLTVAEAHKVDFEAEEIGEDNVEEGKPGWDLAFTLKDFGDSHVLFGEGESYARKVSAKKGETLTYFCVIHPDMQGEIRVTK